MYSNPVYVCVRGNVATYYLESLRENRLRSIGKTRSFDRVSGQRYACLSHGCRRQAVFRGRTLQPLHGHGLCSTLVGMSRF